MRLDFTLGAHNSAAVAEICTRLDGLPLAIELVAARCYRLSTRAILESLAPVLAFAVDGPRDLPARQQTLRATTRWSYDLLSEAEQRLFRRLAVFAGGCTMESAQAVCNADGDLGLDVAHGLTSLTEKSLLRHVPVKEEARSRYEMLETIREFALERLEASGEDETLHRRHAEHFLNLTRAAAPQVRHGQPDPLRRLAREHDNLRAVLGWNQAQADPDPLGATLAASLVWFWHFMGYLTEGRTWLEKVLEKGAGEDQREVRAQTLFGAGLLASQHGEYRRAAELCRAALSLSRQIGYDEGIAYSLFILGQALNFQGAYDAASAMLAESVQRFEALGDPWGVAEATLIAGNGAQLKGDLPRAQTLLEQSVDAFRALRDRRGLSSALYILGYIAIVRADYAAARALFEESLALFEEIGAARGANATRALMGLGFTAFLEGAYDDARSLLVRSFVLLLQLGDRYFLAHCLTLLAGLAIMQGQLARGARLWGSAERLRETLGVPLPRLHHALYHDLLNRLRRDLDEETVATLWREGRRLALSELSRYVVDGTA